MGFCQEWEAIYKGDKHLSVWPWNSVVSLTHRFYDLNKNLKVLELGCGAGANIPYFASFDNIEYYGLEAGVPQNMILSKKKSLEDNVMALEELFYESIPDANIFKAAYYQEFFKHFNINVPDIARDIIDGYDEKLLFSDFDSYRTCGKYYFKRHDIDKVVLKSNQREKSYTGYPRGGSSTKTVTVESLFGKDTELTQAILDLTNEAVLSFGAGVSGFKISNMGTKKSPNEYVYVLITLDDLIKALPEMPQTLKDEIITNKFQRIEIEFDKDKVVK